MLGSACLAVFAIWLSKRILDGVTRWSRCAISLPFNSIDHQKHQMKAASVVEKRCRNTEMSVVQKAMPDLGY
jgi:hypothetical protein